MKGIFDILKKDGVLKFLGQARRPEPVVHVLMNHNGWPNINNLAKYLHDISYAISNYLHDKTLFHTDHRQIENFWYD